MWGEPAPGAWLHFGMEMMILIKQLCWEEASGLSGCWSLESRDAAGPRDEGCSSSERPRAGPAGSQSTDPSIHRADGCGDARRDPGKGSCAPFPLFPIPLQTQQEFALLPLPSPAAHHLGLEQGQFLIPQRKCRGTGRCAWITHVAQPCAPSPCHGKHTGRLCRCRAPGEGGVPQPRQGGSRSRPHPAVLGPADPPGAAGSFGHPLLLQINGCAVKKIEAIILRSHPLYPPTSTT